MRKIKKILSAATAAAVLAASVVAAPASAAIKDPGYLFWGGFETFTDEFSHNHAKYMLDLAITEELDPNIPEPFDRGVDLAEIGGVEFIFQVPEESQAGFDGDFGGMVGARFNTRAWEDAWQMEVEENPAVNTTDLEKFEKYVMGNASEFWGIADAAAGINTQGTDKDIRVAALGDYKYSVKGYFLNPVADGTCTADKVMHAQVFMDCYEGDAGSWGNYEFEIVQTNLLDDAGNVLLELDGDGAAIIELVPSDSTNIHFDTHFDEGDGDGANIIADLLITPRADWAGAPMTLDVDFSKLGGVAATFHIAEGGRDKFYGTIGGSVGASFGVNPPADEYGWTSTMFGGILDVNAPYPTPGIAPNGVTEDPDLPSYLDFMDPEWGTFVEPLGDYTYRVKSTFNNPVADGVCTVDQLTAVRVFLQLWDSTGIWHEDTEVWEVLPLLPNYIDYVEIERFVLFDIDNNPILAIDGSGKVVATTAADAKDPVMPTKPGPAAPTPPAGGNPGQPGASQPDTGDSDTSEPTTSEPTTSEPSTSEPSTSEPDEDTTVFEPAVDEEVLAELDEETKDIVQNVVVEDDSGAFEEGTVMNIGDVEKTEESFSFDITFTKDGNEVQPKSKVTVKIPVPEYLQNVTVYLYHYDENGRPTAVKFEIKDGVMIFEATSFSKYEISTVRIAEAFAEDDTSAPTTDGTSNPGSNPSTGIGFVFVPGILAAGALIISKKRK